MAHDDRPSELDHQLMRLERQLRQSGSRHRCAATIGKINLCMVPPPSPLEWMTRPVPPAPSPGALDVLSRSSALPAWVQSAIEAKGFRPRALEKALHTGTLVFTSLDLGEGEEHATTQGWHQPRQPDNLAEADDARFYGIKIGY
jgi:hypothetical protein